MQLNTTSCGPVEVSYVVNGPIETNTYFAISGTEAVVVDPAWAGEGLAQSFAAAHPDVRIVAIVCTHGHADHVGGVAGMRRALGPDVPYLLPADDSEMPAVNIAHQRIAWGIETEDPGAPDRLIAEGDVIAFGDAALQVIAAPGHTPGGVVLFCPAEGGPVAFVGDTLFPGSHGRTDLAGGDEAAIRESLARLGRLLPPETTCLVGHGPSTTVERELASNPFLQGA